MTTEPAPERTPSAGDRYPEQDEAVAHPEEVSASIQRAVHTRLSISGPLPPPELLARYEELVPGAADRIIRMAEGEESHRHQMEKSHLEAMIKDVNAERFERRIGQLCGVFIGIAALTAGTIVAINVGGWPGGVAGSILGGSGVATLVAVFVKGGVTQDAEASRTLGEHQKG